MRTPEDGFYKRFTVECSRVQIGERGVRGGGEGPAVSAGECRGGKRERGEGVKRS